MKRIPHLLSGLSILVLAGACRVIYDAEISGFVKDISTESGVNGTTIRVYSEDPAEDGTRNDGCDRPDDAGPGEDSIDVDFYFPPGTNPGNMYSFFPGDGNALSGRTIRSWLMPNYLPDAIDPDPAVN